jgi:hypothetical protein
MKRIMIWTVSTVLFLAASTVVGATVGDRVQVEIRSDSGWSFPVYPTASCYPKKKVYLEAMKGEEYTIVVRNLLSRRVGFVIAVDGRNIITGKKSWLRNSERMYILGPYETGEFRGWRTGSDRVNRFYFTEAADSYAAAFGDQSAMGVIAIAAYPEIERCLAPPPCSELSRGRSGAAAPPSAKAQGPESKDRCQERAGTGYGQQEYSPVRVVSFEPEARALETILIKYEWRSTLCRMGVIPHDTPEVPSNRLWDEEGYAPPPPGRK